MVNGETTNTADYMPGALFTPTIIRRIFGFR